MPLRDRHVSFCTYTDSPYALIVRRYLSLLDAAVELEYRDYAGPRLQDTHKVLMFDHALTADEVNRKYRYPRPDRGGILRTGNQTGHMAALFFLLVATQGTAAKKAKIIFLPVSNPKINVCKTADRTRQT